MFFKYFGEEKTININSDDVQDDYIVEDEKNDDNNILEEENNVDVKENIAVENENKNVEENNEKIENNTKNENQLQEKTNTTAEKQTTTNTSSTSKELTDKEKAIELVKEKYGFKDKSYSYKIENVDGNEYTIRVSNNSTASVIGWYTVNIKTGEIKEE